MGRDVPMSNRQIHFVLLVYVVFVAGMIGCQRETPAEKTQPPQPVSTVDQAAQQAVDAIETPMESFWGTLKNELVHHRHYDTRAQAIREITEYNEIFYNRQRRHSRLGNLSPAAFAQQWSRQQPAA